MEVAPSQAFKVALLLTAVVDGSECCIGYGQCGTSFTGRQCPAPGTVVLAQGVIAHETILQWSRRASGAAWASSFQRPRPGGRNPRTRQLRRGEAELWIVTEADRSTTVIMDPKDY